MSAGERLPGTPEPTLWWTSPDGLRLAGDAWGDPDAPLVILLHGGGQTRHAWKNAGEVLARAGYHAVTFDARGHGDSDWPGGPGEGSYTQDAMVGDLCAIVAACGKRPALVGASMGGGTSLTAVGEDRVDATALVLVDIAPRIEMDGVAAISDFMARNPDGFASLEEVADAVAGYQPHRKRPRDVSGLAKNVRRGADGRLRWHWDPAFLQAARHYGKRLDRLEACAQRLTLPTLLVRGGLSDLLSEAGAQAFLRTCPHAEYVSVSDAHHMVAGDRNDIFLNAVAGFLQRVVPPQGAPVQAPHALQPHHEGPAGEVTDVP